MPQTTAAIKATPHSLVLKEKLLAVSTSRPCQTVAYENMSKKIGAKQIKREQNIIFFFMLHKTNVSLVVRVGDGTQMPPCPGGHTSPTCSVAQEAERPEYTDLCLPVLQGAGQSAAAPSFASPAA